MNTEPSGGPYRIARTVFGGLLLGLAGVAWALRTDIDSGQLLLMLGTGSVLLGVDVIKRFIQ